MQLSSTVAFASLAVSVTAKLHFQASCVKDLVEAPSGGTPGSVSYTWDQYYEILGEATRCACELYRQRNTGNKQWDQCPDCQFDGVYCNSNDWHIGGDEMAYYCTEKCGAEASIANQPH
ncbi:hypothetical protein LZ30DRAFT_741257 [Colletotrichum cereale]|nr:hypothetical protein LZ30DRAFT_741257 [Colletotrichum cereale]